jgi:hypothetical protein
MRLQNFALCSTALLFATVTPLAMRAAENDPSYSGTWETENKSDELVVEQSNNSIHLKQLHGAQVLVEYTCNSMGKDCAFKEEGKNATVAVYFNGPKMVELRTRGNVVVKRRFGLKDGGKTLEVELMPIAPSGKTETILYAKQ